MQIFDPGTVAHLLSTYGYAAVFLLVMLESSGVPLLGEMMLVAAAVYTSTGHGLAISPVIGCAALGAIAGDNIGYWVGREFGLRIVTRWGPRVGLDDRKQKLGQYLFARYGGSIVFFGRFVAVLRAFAALLAGVNRLPPRRFFLFNAAGGIVWASVFGIGGSLLGEEINRITGPIGWVALALALIGAVLLRRIYKRHEERLLAHAETAMSEQASSRS